MIVINSIINSESIRRTFQFVSCYIKWARSRTDQFASRVFTYSPFVVERMLRVYRLLLTSAESLLEIRILRMSVSDRRSFNESLRLTPFLTGRSAIFFFVRHKILIRNRACCFVFAKT